jgi:hypothetical protein
VVLDHVPGEVLVLGAALEGLAVEALVGAGVVLLVLSVKGGFSLLGLKGKRGGRGWGSGN